LSSYEEHLLRASKQDGSAVALVPDEKAESKYKAFPLYLLRVHGNCQLGWHLLFLVLLLALLLLLPLLVLRVGWPLFPLAIGGVSGGVQILIPLSCSDVVAVLILLDEDVDVSEGVVDQVRVL